jgi:hypothetical protein
MLRILALPALALLAGALTERGVSPAPTGDPVTFRVRVENVSATTTLKLSNGETAPAPTAPVLWLVHTTKDPIFRSGQRDEGKGLEHLAEDGNPGAIAAAVAVMRGVRSAGFVNVPKGAAEAGPILPGNAYEFEITASAGELLTIAFMFGQSNDLFYAPDGQGIALFDDQGRPLAGDITDRLQLWDAGTEVNQEPGLGADQAPRQKSDNTGTAENGVVRLVKDAYTYPGTSEVIRVTLKPAAM